VKSTRDIVRIGAACIGAIALAGIAAGARAEGTTAPTFKYADGVVANVDFSAKSLEIHPAIGDNVTVFVTSSTRFSRDGGSDPSPHPKPHTQAETPPDPASFIGLYVRAQYDPSTFAASTIWLRPATPLQGEGTVHSASDTGLSVDLADGRSFMLALDGNTVCRLDGQPVPGHALSQGDPVSFTFFLKPTENLATLVFARTPAPLTFGGLFVPAVQANTFGVQRGSKSLTFTVDDKTVITIGDKPATLADFKANQYVGVSYRADGSVFVAIKLIGQGPSTGDSGGGGGAGKPNTHPNQGPNNGDNKGGNSGPHDGENKGGNTGPNNGPTTDPNTGAAGGGGGAGKTTNPTQPDESHPAMEAALKALEQAKFYLQHAARDFKGHRAAAQDLTDKAIAEVLAGLATDNK
jgi:hypothetical protein